MSFKCQVKMVKNSNYEDVHFETDSDAISGFEDTSTVAIEDEFEATGFVKKKNIIMTRAELHTENPVLQKGQIGIESDTGRVKIGDGTTKYSLLSYAYINQIQDD